MKIWHVVGARPNFMKVAPIIRAMKSRPDRFDSVLVHTGQHYDESMSEVFFEDLGLPHPDYHLNIGSGSHAEQTARVMLALEPLLRDRNPDLVLVVGDVNSTLGAALVAAKLGIRLAHVEAGLRSFDRSMPEEINRVLTDAVADLLFTTERTAADNLAREGIDRSRIHFVGNVMIDTLLAQLPRATALGMAGRLGLEGSPFVLVTLHRPSNVDQPDSLSGIIHMLERVQTRARVVFPMHPRTRARLVEFGLEERLSRLPGVILLEPLGYLEFLGLLAEARLVITDSGGLQEETTILGIPCLTARANTERPVTVTEGTNELLTGTPEDRALAAFRILDGATKAGRKPELWDGHAAERIVEILDSHCS